MLALHFDKFPSSNNCFAYHRYLSGFLVRAKLPCCLLACTRVQCGLDVSVRTCCTQERSKEAEQAAQVQEDSGKVAERRKQAAAQQQDVVWGRKIPQISRNEKSTEAQQADQVKQDSALVSERRKAADSQQQQQQPQPQESIGSPGDFIQELAPPSLFNDEKAVWYEYPVADQQKSLEAQQADQVKQDSAKVAERRKKRKEEQRLSAVSFSL